MIASFEDPQLDQQTKDAAIINSLGKHVDQPLKRSLVHALLELLTSREMKIHSLTFFQIHLCTPQNHMIECLLITKLYWSHQLI